ncbi:apiosidase-like domain-containing protein [Floccifex sp.]|uniref:apiosidase-like domain-containing protein n=1 Tax=Floccifex sp. TaxID=2815810 RepID=UPI003F0E21BB
MKIERYKTIRLSFTTQIEDPYFQCQLKAIFTNGKTSIIRQAYWDGNQTMKIAFAPIESGTWHYVLESNDSSLNGITGQIECIPYTGNLDIYKHGFIQVSEDKRYFTYADGTSFFWLGDTHWEFAYKEKWDASNHPDMDSMFKGMVDKRAKQQYTIYQTNLRSDEIMGGDKYYWKDGRPNISFYQNELDKRMEYIANAGLVNALGLAWFMSIENQVEKYKELACYILARYGSYPMVYTLAGEVAGYDARKRDLYIQEWEKVALFIHENDSYHHPLTAHYTNERPFACYYQDKEWMDFTLNQAGHGDYVIQAMDYLNYLKDKPFVEGEAFYEFCSTLEENGTRLCDEDMVRRVAYLTIQSGGCGYTYGAQGIWDCVWEKGQDNAMEVFNQFDIPWYIAIDGQAGKQMTFFKQFYLDQHFESLYPYQTNSDPLNNPFGKKMPLITVSKDYSHWVLYYPASSRKSGEIKDMVPGLYHMQWFNPRTGQYESSFEVEIQNTWKIISKPDRKDWCLVIKGEKYGKD